MKRLLITLMILGLACSASQAQSILRRLERTARTAAERAAERKVEEKVEEEVNKALDEALEESEKEKQEEGSDKNKEGRSSSRRAVQNQDLEFDDWDMEAEDLEMMKRTGQNGSYRRDSGTSGNNNSSQRSAGQTSGNASRRASDQDSRSGATTSDSARNANSQGNRNTNSQGNRNAVSDSGQDDPQNRRAQMEWAKSDFVAGDEIFFEDNLVGKQLGEFPSHWDIIEGNAEVVRIDGENAIMLLDDARLVPSWKTSNGSFRMFSPWNLTFSYTPGMMNTTKQENILSVTTCCISLTTTTGNGIFPIWKSWNLPWTPRQKQFSVITIPVPTTAEMPAWMRWISITADGVILHYLLTRGL